MKKFSKTRWVLTAALACLFVVPLTGCKKEEAPPSTDLAVIALQGCNMPSLSTDIPTVRESIFEAASAYEGSSFTFISATGDPEAVTIQWQEKSAKNSSFWKKEVEDRCEAAARIVENVVPSSAETDVFQSLHLASRALRAGNGQQKKILVAHSGLSTSGLIQFQQSGVPSNSESEALIQILKDDDALPDLSGTIIQWIYCGDTVLPQGAVSVTEQKELQTFWKKLLVASGARDVIFSSDIPTTDSVKDALPVTVVPTGTQPETLLPDSSHAIALDPGMVKFSPDSATVEDPDQAVTYLANFAEEICSTDALYLVVGSTAHVEQASEEELKAFSLKRARAIQKLLIDELNVPADKLQVIGLGDQDTSLRSTEEQLNRCVWIVQADSPLGQELLAVA